MQGLVNRFAGLASSALLLALGACSSGDSGNNDVPPPPPVQTTGTLSVGVITGFGSVYVDGVRYETSSAEVTMDGVAATPAQLRVGQYVEAKGHAQGDAHHAEIIRYHNVLEGPITAIDPAASSFVAMGQTVLVTSDTSLGDAILPASIDGLAIGDVVEVSGVVPLSGPIDATRVDIKPDGGPYEVTGYVAGVDGTLHVFDINALAVDYSAASMSDFPTGLPAVGDLVLVKGFAFASNGSFLATEVELRSNDCLRPGPGDVVEVEGLIANFVSATDFEVAGMRVTTTAATTYEHGTVGDLAGGIMVRVKGATDARGALVASRIAFETGNTVRIVAQVSAVNAASGSLRLLGLEVASDEFTRFEDDSALDLREFDLGDVAVGDWLDVRGYQQAADAGTVVATRVERIDAQEQVRLRGPFRAVVAPNFAILTVAVTTSDSTVFRLENAEPPGDRLSREQLFDLAIDEIVEVWGDWTGASLAADRVVIKVCDD
jgi:Domain of unknown function (DUF5666)